MPAERGGGTLSRRLLFSGDVELVLKLVNSDASCLRDLPLTIPRTETRPVFPKTGQLKVGSQVLHKAEDEGWLQIGKSAPELCLR